MVLILVLPDGFPNFEVLLESGFKVEFLTKFDGVGLEEMLLLLEVVLEPDACLDLDLSLLKAEVLVWAITFGLLGDLFW